MSWKLKSSLTMTLAQVDDFGSYVTGEQKLLLWGFSLGCLQDDVLDNSSVI